MRDIVVGVEETGSEHVLARAVEEAEERRCGLRVVRAWTTPVWPEAWRVQAGVPDGAAVQQSVRRDVAELVAKALASARDPEALRVRIETPERAAGPALVGAAADAAVLVVGGKHRNRLSGALLGTTTTYALHHATAPVMVVPTSPATTATPRHVVVGVDGSPASRSALRWAAATSRRVGCPLEVVHGWLLASYPEAPPMTYVPDSREYEQRAARWLAAEIAEVLPHASAETARARLLHSEPAAALLQAASSEDLLVVGSRGRGGFTALVLGSVAAQCAQHASSPVVVVRAGEERLGDG